MEISRDASFKELRALLGRWMNANPENVSFVTMLIDCVASLPMDGIASHDGNLPAQVLQVPRRQRPRF